jgi:heme oxygenase
MRPPRESGMLSLRHATHDAHVSIDADLRQGNWLRSPTSYAGFLDRTLRFHRIVESALAPVLGQIEDLGYVDRRRSPLLEEDLATLARVGVLPDLEQEHSVRAPPLLIDGAGAALGCLYVIEGAQLGATVLARWIETRLGYDRDFGASGFAARPGTTMSRWRAFGALVEARLASVPGDRVLMLAAAQTTFAVHRAVVVDVLLTAEALTS